MDRHTSTKATVVKRSKTKPWLSKVRVHLSRLWADTQVRKATVAKMSTKKPWLKEVRVHLSRLWTDTQVRKATVMKMSQKKTWVGRSTSAPVTSMDRHTSTHRKANLTDKKVRMCTDLKQGKFNSEKRSTSAPATSMDRHTSTKQLAKNWDQVLRKLSNWCSF